MKNTKRNLKLVPFNLRTVVCLALMTATQLMAKDNLTGTADLDSDGDGDPIANGSTFNIDLANNAYENSLIGYSGLADSSSLNSQWWVSDTQQTGWEEYIDNNNTGTLLYAHILDPIAPGTSFYIQKSFEYGVFDYTSSFRESNGVLPTATNVYFGLSDYAQKGDFSTTIVSGTNNLTYQGATTPDGYDSAYSWFHYTVDSLGTDIEWTIKTAGEASSPITSWIAVFELPGGAGVGAGTDWALSGFDDKGNFGSVTPGDEYYEFAGGPGPGNPALMDDPTTDVVFSWTVDAKNDTVSPTENPNFGTEPSSVPEPTSFLLVGTGMMLFLFKRKR